MVFLNKETVLFCIKNKGNGKAEAWIEVFASDIDDWSVACKAKLIIVGDQCLIDVIETPLGFRKLGYATEMIKELKERFKTVQPIGVEPSAKGFWEKMGMEDALGEEEEGA